MVILWGLFALCVAIGVAAAVLTRVFGVHVLWLWLSILCLGAMHGLAWYDREPSGWTLILVVAIAAPMLAALGIGTLAGMVPDRGYWPDPDGPSDCARPGDGSVQPRSVARRPFANGSDLR